jgi:hypothetical protein
MKIFAFDPADYRSRYHEQNWLHVQQGMTSEFHAELEAFVNRSLSATKLDRFAIKGKKEQSLYEFPDATDFPGEIFDVVSAVTGLNRATMTLSERHIQAYDPDADPEPDAHKDRYPSQVSLGFSIAIPPDSRLVLYPYDQRELNPFNSAASFQRYLQPHEHPSEALRGAREVEIADQAGDIVMFPGSTTWHLRRRAANAVNLYVKLNDFDCDPLGEDPSTPERRTRTLELLKGSDQRGLEARVASISRRLDFVSCQYSRNSPIEVLQVALYGEEPFGLTQEQHRLVREIDGVRTLESVIDAVAESARSRGSVASDARLLIERGVLDLLN